MANPSSTPVVAASIETTHGKTVIDDNVIAKIAGIATRDTPGVYALGGGAARAIGAIREALNTTDLGQGIGVEVGDTQVAVDISIVAEYPVPLQKVGDEVRAAVISAISTLVGLEVTEVNITVNDVHIASEDDDDQDDRPTPAAKARVQ